MNKFFNTVPLPSILSGLFQSSAIILIYYGYTLPAQIFTLAGALLLGIDMPKFTTSFQLFLGLSSATIMGLSFEFGMDHFPLLMLALFLSAAAILLRLVFYKNMLHTRFLWLDPFIFLIALICYFSANIYYHYSWQGWIFPCLYFLFGIKLLTGQVHEGKAYVKLSKNGYGAKVGMPSPDFSLPDQNGNTVTLSDFRGKRHVLLLFVRGDWCPACHMMIRAYEKGREKFLEKNVFLLAVGPDTEKVNRNMAERIGVEFLILSDVNMDVTKKYGVHIDKDPVARKTSITDGGLPLPASFLICDKGIVRYHSSPEKVGEFLNPSAIMPILESLN